MFKRKKDPQKYMIYEHKKSWEVMAFSDGTIFIKIDLRIGDKIVKCSCNFSPPKANLPTWECPQCQQQLWCSNNWCRNCETRNFTSNFGNWTSGNRTLNQFIQYSQSNPWGPLGYLEWIP